MYSINECVGASKTGVNGLMTLVGALNSIQDCSLFWLESEPEFHKFLIENNMGIFIASRQVDIVRMPEYAEKITDNYGCVIIGLTDNNLCLRGVLR